MQDYRADFRSLAIQMEESPMVNVRDGQCADISYRQLSTSPQSIEHCYGERVFILKNLRAQTLLAKLCRPETEQPLLNFLITKLYLNLLTEVVNTLTEREIVNWNTRMSAFVKEGVYCGEVVDQNSLFVSVDLARAGILPSQVCFEELSALVQAKNVRQDHFYMQRKVNDKHEVVGVDVAGSKIGGGQENSIVLFPDPMAATGSSLSYAVSHYKKHVQGKAKAYVAMHLIVTPEYIAKITKDHPDVYIFALRLDRGLSAPDILTTTPGTKWSKERGLTDNHYIVPGAGGVGEILNNSYV